jgi:hypothetical protein
LIQENLSLHLTALLKQCIHKERDQPDSENLPSDTLIECIWQLEHIHRVDLVQQLLTQEYIYPYLRSVSDK